MSFLQKSKAFVKKLIKIREHLLRTGANKKDQSTMKALTTSLKYWLSNKNDSSSMAMFIQKHSDKLYAIMPGEAARNHNSLKSEFETLLEESNQYA